MHLEVYWKMLSYKKGSTLKLTQLDDEIYEHLLREFPEFQDTKAGEFVDEEVMKSKDGKDKWRKFMNTYEKTVDDFNFGTMLRRNSKEEYTEANTMFVPRMQFYAIEIFRNKRGLNDWVYEQAHSS